MIKHDRKRYLSLRVESETLLNEKDFFNIIMNSTLQLFGEYGASHANLYVVNFDPIHGEAILRCSHKTVNQVRAAIATITEVSKDSITIHVMKVSGTIKSLRRKKNDRKASIRT